MRRAIFIITFCVGFYINCASRSLADDAPPAATTPVATPPAGLAGFNSNLVAVAKPPFSADIFPCSDCHDPEDKVNTNRRELTEEHTKIHLKHDEENRWCLDCHDAKNRDKLHLASGKLIDFEESYLLCGQCHGPTLRDWKLGIHGKRTGSWSGKKEYLLCAHCHNPHSPHFAPLKPLPPPVKPDDIK